MLEPLAVTANRQEQTAAASYVTALVEQATPVLLVNKGATVEFANRAACTMLGCSAAPLVMLDELFAAAGVYGRISLPDGTTPEKMTQIRLSDCRVVNVEGRHLPGGGAILTLDDVSAFVREAERARADPLTGLANRAALHAALSGFLASGTAVAVLYIDLDRFKSINDTLGHPVGDALLRKVAERLGSVAGQNDVVARLGGDEFALVRPDAVREEVKSLAARIVDLIGRAYVLEGHMINVGASVGVTLAPFDGNDSDVLFRNADLALYRAKAEGRSRFRFFEPEMDLQMQARRAIELDLRRALALKEFNLVYQPQVDLATHEVVGFEALLRWDNEKRGPISPAEFIPIAEETGLIVSIGEWVLRTACAEAASWGKPVSIAVNLSAIQFQDRSLVRTVTSALAHSGLDPGRLELEITESALMSDTEAVVSTLRSLRNLSIRISMDDFGTGYSSLSYLQKFPFDKIKIDQSFVRGMADNVEAGAIVRAVARLGSSLGIETTAEGVETQEQLAAVRAEGCSHVQGYFIGRPMSSSDAAALVTRNAV